jgi:hypothetical protein
LLRFDIIPSSKCGHGGSTHERLTNRHRLLHERSGWATNAKSDVLFLHKPVIASNVGALPSMIIRNYNGVLIPPGDPERLTEAIPSLSNAETRFRLTGGLPRRVPTWNEIVSKLVAVYLGFAQHHG